MIMMDPFEPASKTKIINFIYKSSLAHDVSSQQLNNDQDNGKFIDRLFWLSWKEECIQSGIKQSVLTESVYMVILKVQ